tara:strand:+ start:200 stop:982 length:783 start_codon:yes stop_codon:yes gene_type:complete
MRLLGQNPKIFTSNTCPLPYFIDACHTKLGSQREILAMDMELSNKAYLNFLYGGIKSWFETLTDKPIVISKSKMWATFFPHTFAFDNTSRYIVLVRDLRDIFCSYEVQTWRRPMLKETYQQVFEERVKKMVDPAAPDKLGPWLLRISHIMETARKNLRNFMFIRQEDFTAHPKEHLEDIYKFIEEKNFEHDLNNLPDAAYYEHDAIYQQPISHKVRKKLEDIKPRWPSLLTKEESAYFLDKFEWYYKLFYPEFLQKNVNG